MTKVMIYTLYWVLLAPLVWIIAFGIQLYPVVWLLEWVIWPVGAPAAVEYVKNALAVLAFVTACLAVWWVWRRFRVLATQMRSAQAPQS